MGAEGVRGNHDAAALGGPEIDWFNPDARAAIEWTRDTISSATRGWLSALPERRVLEDMTLVHGSLRDPIREYISSVTVARANLDVLETPHGLHGHTHVPVAFAEEGDARVGIAWGTDRGTFAYGGQRTLLNPGSVGQPRDGDPRSSYMVLDTDAETTTWHRVAYDIDAVQSAMRARRLPARLVERLAVGL